MGDEKGYDRVERRSGQQGSKEVNGSDKVNEVGNDEVKRWIARKE